MNRLLYKGNWTFTVRKDFILSPSLSPLAKLVYIAIKSYCSEDGTAFPSAKTIAAGLGIHVDTVYGYVKELEKDGWLEREQTRGQGSQFSNTVYTLHEKPQEPAPDAAPPGEDPRTETPGTVQDLSNTSVPYIRESLPKVNGNRRNLTKNVTFQKEAQEIYELYPRKVARPKALVKIEKAVREHGYEKVLKSVTAFAKVWKGRTDLEFCPHPATWFSQERFNDDPSTWNRPVLVGEPVCPYPITDRRNPKHRLYGCA